MQVHYMYTFLFLLFCFNTWKSLKAFKFNFYRPHFSKDIKGILEVQASSSLIPQKLQLQKKRLGKFSNFFHSSNRKELRIPHAEDQDLYLWYIFQHTTEIEFATRCHLKQSNIVILVIKSLVEPKF